MMIRKTSTLAFIAASLFGAAGAASAEEAGTMNLMPSGNYAVAMSDSELATKRGGFLGIAFSATFTATVENMNGNVNGTGTTTPPVSPSGQPVNTNIENGQVTISSFVGNMNNVSGVFNIVQVPGSFNVVNANLTVQVAIVNVTNGQIPTLNTIFGR